MKKIDENTSYEELLKQKRIGMFELGVLCVATSALPTILINPAPFIPFLGITYKLINKEAEIEEIMAENDENIKAIKIIYDEILENTIKEFKKFELNNPIETYQLFDSMFRYGSFSYDLNCSHPLKMSIIKSMAMEKILFLNGHGVCRHSAVFLNKIYESLGYESDIASGHLNTTNQKDFDAFLDECIDFPLTREETSKRLITEYLKPGIFSKLNYEKKKGYYNHALPRVNFDSMTILTDPSTRNIFGFVLGDVCLTISPPSNSIFVMNRSTTKNFNDSYDIDPIREYTDYTKYKLDVINSAITEGMQKVKEAESAFESFHKDNLPALEEAENLTQMVLKKKY